MLSLISLDGAVVRLTTAHFVVQLCPRDKITL